MDDSQNNQKDKTPYQFNKYELVKLYYTRDIQGLEVLLIDFSVNYNLLQYINDHKRIAIEEANKFFPLGKQRDFSLGFSNLNVILRTRRRILKEDFPDLDQNHPPQYILDWVEILNCYASCFFLPNLGNSTPEEKQKFKEEVKTSPPNTPGRPKTYTPLSFRQEIIAAARELSQSSEDSLISKNKIADKMGIQRNRLNDRLEETGIDDETFYKLIQQAKSIK